MKEHPILFNTEMVCAILNGRKTQTRRPAKIPLHATQEEADRMCHPYAPGDLLWVRETWNLADPDSDSALPEDIYGPYAPFTGSQGSRKIHWRAIYRADSPASHPKYGKALWRPSIHMPKWACRLFLEVDDVGIHRLQDISEEDAKAEGVKAHRGLTFVSPYLAGFHLLWDALYGGAGLSWGTNPWVCCTKFHIAELKT